MYTRRQFLRGLGLATAAGAIYSPIALLARIPHPAHRSKVIVIGAGLAGLCAAYELEERGHEVVVLEAHPKRLGGRVYTQRFGENMYGELGAMRIPPQHSLPRHYAGRFGLPLRRFVQSNPLAFYFVRGHRIRMTDAARLQSLYQLSSAEQNKTLSELWSQTVLRELAMLTPEERADLREVTFKTEKMRGLDQYSLGAFLKLRGLSPEAIETLGVAWGYETSLNTALTEILREEHESVSGDYHEIIGGTDRLPEAFAQRLRSAPRRGCEVVRIEQDAKTARAIYKDRKARAHFKEAADAVLCTVPLGILSQMETVPELSGEKRRAIRQITYDSSTKVLALTRRRFWELEDGIYGGGTYTDLPIGMSYYPSDNADAHDHGVSRGRGVLLASYTWGLPARRLAALSAAQRSDLVVRNLARVHPQLLEARMIDRVVSWCWDNNPLQPRGVLLVLGRTTRSPIPLPDPAGRSGILRRGTCLPHPHLDARGTRIGLAGRGADPERASRTCQTLNAAAHSWALRARLACKKSGRLHGYCLPAPGNKERGSVACRRPSSRQRCWSKCAASCGRPGWWRTVVGRAAALRSTRHRSPSQ